MTLTWRKASASSVNGNCVEIAFRKSRQSVNNGACVEVAFRKSSHSAQGECVEVADGCGQVHVRDSKDPDGAILTVSSRAWHAFLADVRDGLS